MSEKKDIGALWKKQGKSVDFLSGYIEIDGQKIEIVCFENSYKKESKHPDFKIMRSQRIEKPDPSGSEDDTPF